MGEIAAAMPVRKQAVELVRLAAPVVIARASIMSMVLVDTIMVGRYGATALAELALASAFFVVLHVSAAGLLIGTLIFAANSHGARAYTQCGQVWRRSLPYAAFIGMAGFALCLLAEPLFLVTRQTPELATGGASLALILGAGTPFLLCYIVSANFLEGIKRPLPAMIIMLFANIVNVGANWVFIFGELGMPELGAMGAVIATNLVRFVALCLILGYIWHMRDWQLFGVRVPDPNGWRASWRGWADQRKLGFAHGLSAAIEASAFSAMTLLAGLLGTMAIAAYTITLNLIGMNFMIALGFASATTVCIGNARGAADYRAARLTGWTGLALCAAIQAAIAIGMALNPAQIGGFYTTQTDLLATIVPLIALTAWVIVLDGGQAVMANALRGWNDSWVPTLTHLCAYAIVMIPCGWWLTQRAGHGPLGLIEAILIATVISISLLCLRYIWLTGRHVRAAR